MIIYYVTKQPFLKAGVDWAPAKMSSFCLPQVSCGFVTSTACFFVSYRMRKGAGAVVHGVQLSRYSPNTYSWPGSILKDRRDAKIR